MIIYVNPLTLGEARERMDERVRVAVRTRRPL